MKKVSDYIELTEVNRIIQGLSRASGKPADHIGAIWKDTDKQVITKHTGGVTDKYKTIGNIVRSKLGLPAKKDDEPANPEEDEDQKPKEAK